jgi:hypothetical protein
LLSLSFRVWRLALQVNYTRGSPQWEWLLSDLRAVNRSVTPWVLFGGHRPLYVDSDYAGDVEVTARGAPDLAHRAKGSLFFFA